MHKKKIVRNIILIAAIVVFVVLLMTTLDKSTAKMAWKFYTLTNKPSNSSSQFDIPTGRIVENVEGLSDIEFKVAIDSDTDITVDDPEAEGVDPEDDRQKPGEDPDKDEDENKNGVERVSIMGDSISTFEGYIPQGYACHYPNGSVNVATDTWWMKFIDSTDYKLGINASWSGSCVVGSGDSSSQSDRRIKDLGANGEPTLIMIYMGTNDLWRDYIDCSSFRPAYSNMLSKIKKAYPDAEIWCLGLAPVTSGGSAMVVNGETYINFNEVISEEASNAGAEYVSLAGCWSESDAGTYTEDGICHPNKEGMSKIAEALPK